MSTFKDMTFTPKVPPKITQENESEKTLRIIKGRTLYTKVFGAEDSVEGPLGLPARVNTITETNPSTPSTGVTTTTDSANNDNENQNLNSKVAEQSNGDESAEDSDMRFWAVVERAAEYVEKARRVGELDEFAVSEEAIDYSLEMPQGTPLSDPAVIEAIFADTDFMSMCEKAKGSYPEENNGRVCRLNYY